MERRCDDIARIQAEIQNFAANNQIIKENVHAIN